MKEVLSKIGFSDVQIADLEAGKDVETIVETWQKDNEELISSKVRTTVEKDLKEKINSDALKAVTESLKHKVQKATGITVPGARSLEMDEFLEGFKTQIEASKSDDATKKALEKANNDLSDALEKVADLNSKLAAKDQEVETVLTQERAKMVLDDHLGKFFAGQEWGVSKELVEFAMENLKQRAHTEFKLVDGVLKTKAGAPVTYGNTVVKTLPDWLSYEVDKLNLRKKNDGRDRDRDSKWVPSGQVDEKKKAAMSVYDEAITELT